MSEFIYLGSKYRTSPDLATIERQNSQNKRWALTHSLLVREAAREALAKQKGEPIL